VASPDGRPSAKGQAFLDLLFLALAVGLFSSAAERERFRAVRKSLLILGLIVLIPFLG
jgi:hypothetical protein